MKSAGVRSYTNSVRIAVHSILFGCGSRSQFYKPVGAIKRNVSCSTVKFRRYVGCNLGVFLCIQDYDTAHWALQNPC